MLDTETARAYCSPIDGGTDAASHRRNDMKWTTRAAFITKQGGSWSWVKWTHFDPNKHAAILAKAKELGAVAWDFGQADHFEADRYPHGSR